MVGKFEIPRPWSAAWRLAPYLVAIAAPACLAYRLPPLSMQFNHLVAIAGWGWCLLAAPATAARHSRPTPLACLVGALALMAAAAGGSWLWGGLPSSVGLASIGCLLAAMAIAWLGARCAQARLADCEDPFTRFAFALVTAGVGSSLVAFVQVFWPDGPDRLVLAFWPQAHLDPWIAPSGSPGRADGNLEQPNHLASLVCWAIVALVPLLESGRLRARTVAGLGLLFILTILLSGSRTGLYGELGIVALWGLLDRRLSRTARSMLVGIALVTPLLWLGLRELLPLFHQTFIGQTRLKDGDNFRLAIWRDSLVLISQQPWLGVGWGNFNFAWVLTPLPHRSQALFDHCHNLLLQLTVELGIPLASTVIALLLYAWWQGLRRAVSVPGLAGVAPRAAWVMVTVIGLHSLLEYPLWYTYFLLPTAWAWGFTLGSGDEQASQDGSPVPPVAPRTIGWRTVGCTMIAVAGAAWIDYTQAARIFSPDPSPPLAERVAEGERSLLFGYIADFVAADSIQPRSRGLSQIQRAARKVIDPHLLAIWSVALAQSGEIGQSNYLAARLREFPWVDSATVKALDSFCSDPRRKGISPQCRPAPRDLAWRDFLRTADHVQVAGH